jgi:alkylhydroperoxidase family enzyme
MRRIRIPEGTDPVMHVVTELGSPRLNQRLRESWDVQYDNDSTLTPREREAARIRTAHLMGCSMCIGVRMGRDLPGFSPEPIPEELYLNVFDYATWPGYSTRERLAVEFAERYSLDYQYLAEDDEFWSRLQANFTEVEIADLCLLCGTWESATKMYHLLCGLEDSCAITR